MIPEDVLNIIHSLDSRENRDMAVEWYSYIINTKDYITPKKFKELESECGVKDFPQDPFKYEALGNHISSYINYFFYKGDRQLNSPVRVIRNAKSWAETNLKHDYDTMIVEVRSIEYLYHQIQLIDWSHISDFMRRKVFATVNVELKKKYKNNYKDFLQNQLLTYQRIIKTLTITPVIDDDLLGLIV